MLFRLYNNAEAFEESDIVFKPLPQPRLLAFQEEAQDYIMLEVARLAALSRPRRVTRRVCSLALWLSLATLMMCVKSRCCWGGSVSCAHHDGLGAGAQEAPVHRGWQP